MLQGRDQLGCPKEANHSVGTEDNIDAGNSEIEAESAQEIQQSRAQKQRMQKSGYRRGTIDKTLFIKKDKNDIMLVQAYVDDIIFGSTKRSWCDEFE
ncbi:hypothetical protein Tco_0274785, partial [Tanacetum coccineum]